MSIGSLLVEICKLNRNKLNTLLSETGIHAGQDILLYHLSQEDGQMISSLVEKICIQPATISNMIDRMEASGMVKKNKDVYDKRVSRVYITDRGKETFKQVSELWKVMEATTVQGLTPEEENNLRKLLEQVLKNLS